MNETTWSRLLEIQRSGISERIIFGAVAVATEKKLLRQIGGDAVIFGRSLMKPFQMKVIQKELSSVLDWRQKAIALASHNGEAAQIQVAQQILPPEEWKFLSLPSGVPMGGSSKLKSIWASPCSGKHSAILRACGLNSWPRESYLRQAHPYNERYLQFIEQALNVKLSGRVFAPDGCALPTFTISLSELAKLYASLGQTRTQDWIWEAFHRHPELIGGPGRLDTKLLAFPNILAKEGADGLLGLSIVDAKYPEGLGIVVKLAHGYDLTVMQIVAQKILASLGFEFGDTVEFAGQTILSEGVLDEPLHFSSSTCVGR